MEGAFYRTCIYDRIIQYYKYYAAFAAAVNLHERTE